MFQITSMYLYQFQDFHCPPECLCKGHAVYCTHTEVDIYRLPINMTLLYLPYTTSRANNLDVQLSNFPDLGLFNMSHSRIAPSILRNFLSYLPKLRVLLMRNCSIHDLSPNFFNHLRSLHILDLQENVFPVLTSRGFTGLITVSSLDLHDLHVYELQSKTFQSMNLMHLLNLSTNMLDYLDDGIFQSLTRLVSVDLSGNPFKEIDSNAFKKMYSLVVVSTIQLCCYVEPPSICIHITSR